MEKRNNNENRIEMLVNKSNIEKKGVEDIWVEAVRPYAGYPFKLYHDEKLDELVESIKERRRLTERWLRLWLWTGRYDVETR